MCVSTVLGRVVLLVACLLQTCAPEPLTYGPPRVDTKPMLLDSFLPAAMQVMAHVTELMKYDLKPTTNPPSGQTTTTVRPTPPHRPGLYAPEKPPGPQAYFAHRDSSYRDYVERLQQPSGSNYFERYRYPLTHEDSVPNEQSRDSHGRSYPLTDVKDSLDISSDQSVDLEYYIGKNYADILKLATKIEPDVIPNNVDVQVLQFSREFDDDSNFRFELYRQKKVPPTKAYVTLLSLYDMLNRESKKLGLNKYQGYSETVLQVLIESSTGTSAHQLRTVFNKIIERGDTKRPEIVRKIKQLVTDLDEPSSYINLALRYIPPLSFVS